MSELKIGMIGLDTSHVVAFTRILNDPNNEHFITSGKVVIAYPGGSSDMELSYTRIEGFTKELREKFNIEIVGSPEEVAEKSDAILLESVDGRVHLEQFRKIAAFGKPTFIDKPFTTRTNDAKEMIRLAEEHGTPIMSSSSLRYSEGLMRAIGDYEKGDVIGVDCYGPLEIEQNHGLFWYGIHTAEMLYCAYGPGCKSVTVTKSDDHELIIGEWADGRIGSLRGNRKGNTSFGALIHRENGTQFVDVDEDKKPMYVSLLEDVLTFFKTGKSLIHPQETLEITRFLEAANESRATGKTIEL